MDAEIPAEEIEDKY